MAHHDLHVLLSIDGDAPAHVDPQEARVADLAAHAIIVLRGVALHSRGAANHGKAVVEVAANPAVHLSGRLHALWGFRQRRSVPDFCSRQPGIPGHGKLRQVLGRGLHRGRQEDWEVVHVGRVQAIPVRPQGAEVDATEGKLVVLRFFFLPGFCFRFGRTRG